VVEADEYDRSFLKLVPDVAVVTAIDPDHLDIYGPPQEVENAFVQFAGKVKPGGCLVTKKGLSREADLQASHNYRYSYNEPGADVKAVNLLVQNGSYNFDVSGPDWVINNITLHMGGLHNIENVIAAITVAKYLDISNDAIRAAVADFKGVRRRFEYALKNDSHVVIDDYAHHPEELKALISGVRSIFNERKLTLVFQPHLFSRTSDLADGFAESLDMADEVILLPIYPARELPMPGVTSALLASKMKLADKQLLEKEEMLDWIKSNRPSLVVMAGAGDIDALVKPVKTILEQ
jgi:UDP-N-acetylmuramate--alanine ligase